MDKLGLHSSGLRSYHQALADDHWIRVRASVLNLQHERLASIDQRIIDGQVDVSASGEVTRSTEVTFSDETKAISFDSDSPADGALFPDRMLRLSYGVKVPDLGWVDAPIFTGPIFGLKRSAGSTIVTAQGKESMARSPVAAWALMTVKKGVPKVDAIRRIMRERAGENKFAFPDVKARLPKAVSLGRETEPWVVCQHIASSMNMQLYYDAAGWLRLRDLNRPVMFTFRDGTGGTLLPDSPPNVDFDITNVRNIVWVKGGKPKAKRRANETRAEFETRQDKERGVKAVAVAPRNHPLSPWRLGRPDSPRYLLHVIENDHIRSEKEAQQLANRVLDDMLRQHIDITFGSLVVPHLEIGDMARIRTDAYDLRFRMREFSIPLTSSGYMSVGSLRNVQARGRHGHRHHGGRHR